MIRTVRLLLFAPLLMALLAAGCKSGTVGRVSGKVTYNGNPVTGGKIRFFPTTGSSQEGGLGGYEATIQEDGTYSIADVPAGDMVVTVDTEELNPKKPTMGDPTGMGSKMDPTEMMKKAGMVPEGSGGTVGKYMKIPEHYAKKDKSGLTVKVSTGKTTYDPKLTD